MLVTCNRCQNKQYIDEFAQAARQYQCDKCYYNFQFTSSADRKKTINKNSAKKKINFEQIYKENPYIAKKEDINVKKNQYSEQITSSDNDLKQSKNFYKNKQLNSQTNSSVHIIDYSKSDSHFNLIKKDKDIYKTDYRSLLNKSFVKNPYNADNNEIDNDKFEKAEKEVNNIYKKFGKVKNPNKFSFDNVKNEEKPVLVKKYKINKDENSEIDNSKLSQQKILQIGTKIINKHYGKLTPSKAFLWSSLLSVIFLFTSVFYFQHEFISDKFPKTKIIYKKLGLYENIKENIKIENLSTEIKLGGDDIMLSASGYIKNYNKKLITAPKIQISLNNGEKNLVFYPPAAQIDAGKESYFQYDIPIDANIKNINITFID